MQVEEKWWQDFFTRTFNDCWRQLRSDANTGPEADFIESVVPGKGLRILDVPCGGGRIALELTRRGHSVVGVDLSDDFLEEAHRLSAERELDVAWEKRDMRDLPWEGEFDAAICMGTSLGFLDDEGDREFVRAVHRALKPGGKFVIDTNKTLEIMLSGYKPRSWAKLGDITVAYQHEYDVERGRENTEYWFYRDGSVETQRCSQRVYSYPELVQLLRGAGFSQTEGFGTVSLQPVRLSSQRLLLVATK